MTKKDEKIPFRLTGPDGRVLLSGTMADLKRIANDLRKKAKQAAGVDRKRQ